MAAINSFPQLSIFLRRAVVFRPLPQLSRFQQPHVSASILPLSIPTFANITSMLSDLWDSILLAVPKKKLSYSRRRSRQYAGKALKDLINLCRCSSCGRIKRMHILCPYCVENIRRMWANKLRIPEQDDKSSNSSSATAK